MLFWLTQALLLGVAAVTGLSPDFKIDLVEPDTCRETMRDSILKHGIEI